MTASRLPIPRFAFFCALAILYPTSLAAAPPDGSYVGTSQQGERVSIDVEQGKISSLCAHYTGCSGEFLCLFFFNTPCPIAGNGSFDCGSTNSCPSLRMTGTFSASSAQGAFSVKNNSCCSVSGLSFTAALTHPPAAPSNLTATAISSTAVHLAWQDNSNDEDEFAIIDTTTGGFFDVDTAAANTHEATVEDLSPAKTYSFVVSARNAEGESGFSNEVSVTTFGTPQPCVAGDTVLCLSGGRFKVETSWKTDDGKSGTGHAVALTSDSGYFWFFGNTNIEMVVKVLNACSFNNRIWVFAGGLTNVEVTMTVTDSQTGAIKIYRNPQGAPFQPIQDTSAFATCP